MRWIAVPVVLAGSCISIPHICNGQQSVHPSAQGSSKTLSSGPPLKDTLEFLGNAIPPGVDLHLNCSTFVDESSTDVYLRRAYKIETSGFPVINVTITSNKRNESPQTEDSPVISINLSRVDPGRTRFEDHSEIASQIGCGASTARVYTVVLEGTNAQRIFGSVAGDSPSEFAFFVSSKELAERIAAALKHAVVLAGGKESAF